MTFRSRMLLKKKRRVAESYAMSSATNSLSGTMNAITGCPTASRFFAMRASSSFHPGAPRTGASSESASMSFTSPVAAYILSHFIAPAVSCICASARACAIMVLGKPFSSL